jgi:hypothetical protein
MTMAGQFAVVWESWDQDGDQYGIFGQHIDGDGNQLGPEFQVNTTTMAGQAFPVVTRAASGDFLVVWNDYGTITARSFNAMSGALGGELQVSGPAASYSTRPAVDADGSCNFVVAWGQDDGSYGGVFAQRLVCQAIAAGGATGSASKLRKLQKNP